MSLSERYLYSVCLEMSERQNIPEDQRSVVKPHSMVTHSDVSIEVQQLLKSTGEDTFMGLLGGHYTRFVCQISTTEVCSTNESYLATVEQRKIPAPFKRSSWASRTNNLRWP